MRKVVRCLLLLAVVALASVPQAKADTYCDNSQACVSTCYTIDDQGKVRITIFRHC